MEKRQIEFENYIEALAAALNMETGCKEAICEEISQNLYDKQNELLVKGYALDVSAAVTLDGFEDPEKLARAFNREYGRSSGFRKFVNRKLVLAVLAAILVIAGML